MWIPSQVRFFTFYFSQLLFTLSLTRLTSNAHRVPSRPPPIKPQFVLATRLSRPSKMSDDSLWNQFPQSDLPDIPSDLLDSVMTDSLASHPVATLAEPTHSPVDPVHPGKIYGTATQNGGPVASVPVRHDAGNVPLADDPALQVDHVLGREVVGSGLAGGDVDGSEAAGSNSANKSLHQDGEVLDDNLNDGHAMQSGVLDMDMDANAQATEQIHPHHSPLPRSSAPSSSDAHTATQPNPVEERPAPAITLSEHTLGTMFHDLPSCDAILLSYNSHLDSLQKLHALQRARMETINHRRKAIALESNQLLEEHFALLSNQLRIVQQIRDIRGRISAAHIDRNRLSSDSFQDSHPYDLQSGHAPTVSPSLYGSPSHDFSFSRLQNPNDDSYHSLLPLNTPPSLISAQSYSTPDDTLAQPLLCQAPPSHFTNPSSPPQHLRSPPRDPKIDPQTSPHLGTYSVPSRSHHNNSPAP
ncbi:hypothetical protein JAAARDRAFT_201012 [Jaapia argillacea MUCL 33604]|uniref:Uncharacterized protein n=1 Tax=Jaapia argillacea MUCL 33604 TaxID=933084 RepID=A0A067P2W2_9AGAM|nr:hypothetical protein JAAARDRAFT_201012 [Jaapia argillacea MUCL 33604]